MNMGNDSSKPFTPQVMQFADQASVWKVKTYTKAASLEPTSSECIPQAATTKVKVCVSAEDVRTDPDKTRAVVENPVPQDVKHLRQLLGLLIIIVDTPRTTHCLLNPFDVLMRKTAKGFLWTSTCQMAFENLQHKLSPLHLSWLTLISLIHFSGCIY